MWLLFVLVIFSCVQGLERRLYHWQNPGCDKYNMSVSYLKAEGPNDTIHYLWDFTGKPTLFLAVTDRNVSLYINCIYFVANTGNSFNLTGGKTNYEFALIMNKLIEFDDVNDTGILTPNSLQVTYETDNFNWVPVKGLNGSLDEKYVGLTMTGKDYFSPSRSLNGSITIELTAFGAQNHDVFLPKLLHSPNSTQCKVLLENLLSDSGFNNSRFAMEMIMVSSADRSSSSKIFLRKNLDDENSPGIFSIVNVVTPGAQHQRYRGAFLEWRPITYVDKVPNISNSSEVIAYNLTNVTYDETEFYETLPFKFYGSNLSQHMMQQLVVSLGSTQDGFYKKTNYSSWTFLLSYGSPELERFSLLVILVMCIGLGIPTLLIFAGGIYLCVKQIRRKKDELSLEQ